MSITLLWPCNINNAIITDRWQDHVNRSGYNRQYAGTDIAGYAQPLRPSQYGGKVIQAMWSTQGYGNTVFVEHSGILRIRTAHQANLNVSTGDVVNPDDIVGNMGSTGNSTGIHVHWEVWLYRNKVWQNIDPLNPVNDLEIVNDLALVKPLNDTPEQPTPPTKIPVFPNLIKIRPTKDIVSFINLRTLPKVSSADIGDVRKGEIWDGVGYHIDTLGNVWYALKRGTAIGWAAAYYNGEQWLEEVIA